MTVVRWMSNRDASSAIVAADRLVPGDEFLWIVLLCVDKRAPCGLGLRFGA